MAERKRTRRGDRGEALEKKREDAFGTESESEPDKADMEVGEEVAPEEVERIGPNNLADAVEAELSQEAERAVDADVAASNSDMEAAAEEMGARRGEEPTLSGRADTPFIRDWPAVKPTFRRSMADEADAFFAFSQRLQQELRPGGAGNQAPVPVDQADPKDNALMGPDEGDSFARTTYRGDDTAEYVKSDPLNDDETNPPGDYPFHEDDDYPVVVPDEDPYIGDDDDERDPEIAGDGVGHKREQELEVDDERDEDEGDEDEQDD